ncbi:MAG: CDP-diacylglycerol--glycerol-3-phosphate 3-phosphatidyltransferase [Saprospiraceae bacterium]|nr:CDP-diacylglycerol--glycerol-3-phosphate 3-phosphatidyltransferase [Saprospiraceae bacterium]
MNLPNALTVLRIILGVIVPYMMWIDDLNIRIWAAILFAIAAFTDWMDGWYARRYNLVTKLGKILDPIADKIIVLSCFVVLSDVVFEQMYSIWWIVPIFLREVVITVYRLIFLLRKKPIVVAASWSGKAKTVMQMITLPCAYFYLMLIEHFQGLLSHTATLVFWWILHLMIIASLALTVGSGLRFFVKNWKAVKEVTTYE